MPQTAALQTRTFRLDIGYFETDLLENACKITQSLFQTIPHIYKENNVNMFVVQINNLALVNLSNKYLVFLTPLKKESSRFLR